VAFATVFAGQQGPAEAHDVDWLQLGMGLFGGLALFLGGLDLLSEGLKKAAGNTLRTILQKANAPLGDAKETPDLATRSGVHQLALCIFSMNCISERALA